MCVGYNGVIPACTTVPFPLSNFLLLVMLIIGLKLYTIESLRVRILVEY